MAGLAQREQGDLNRAKDSFVRLLSEKPDHIDAAMELLRLSLDSLDMESAEHAAGQALAWCRRPATVAWRGPSISTCNKNFPRPCSMSEANLLRRSALRQKIQRCGWIYERMLAQYQRAPRPKAMLALAQLYRGNLTTRRKPKRSSYKSWSNIPPPLCRPRRRATFSGEALSQPPIVRGPGVRGCGIRFQLLLSSSSLPIS